MLCPNARFPGLESGVLILEWLWRPRHESPHEVNPLDRFEPKAGGRTGAAATVAARQLPVGYGIRLPRRSGAALFGMDRSAQAAIAAENSLAKPGFPVRPEPLQTCEHGARVFRPLTL